MLSKRAEFSGRKDFVLDDHYTMECTYWETPWSWGHYAILYKDGQAVADEKAIYYNRTWESYTYQSVIHSVLNRAGLKDLKAKADEIGDGRVKRDLQSMGSMVALAGLLQPDNESNAKMGALEAITGGAVSRPDDWDTLPEEEKSRRLTGALDRLK